MLKYFYSIRPFIFGLALLSWIASARANGGKYPIRNFIPTEYKAGIQNIDFAQNRNKTLFVANNLGVLSFNGKDWGTHDFKTGKKKRSLAFDQQNNRLYMGSQGDFGFYDSIWQYTSLIELIPSNQRGFTEVWDVYLIEDKVYFCTFEGIYIYQNKTISFVEPQKEFGRSFSVNGKIFTQDQNGQLYELRDQELVQSYPQNQKNEVIAGLVAEDNGLLIIYNSGAIEFSNAFGASPRHPNLVKALRGSFVNHVFQLSDNRLAVATQRSGLYLYNPQDDSLERIATQEGLQSNACLRSFQDYFGNLWIGMQNGIALVHINSPMRLLSQEINLQGSGYEAIDTPQGTYFSTSNGIFFLQNGTKQCVFLSGTEGPAYSIQEIAGRYYAGHHTGLFLLQGTQAKRMATTDGLWQVRQLRSNPTYAIGGTYSGLYLFRIDEQQELQAVQAITGFSASSRFLEEDQLGNLWVGQYYQGLYQLQLSEDYTSVKVENVSAQSDWPIQEQIILSRINEELYLATNAGIYKLDPTTSSVQQASLFEEHIGRQPVYLLAQDQKNRIHVVTEDFIAYYEQVSDQNYQFIPSSLHQLRFHLNNDLLNISTQTEEGVLFSANDGFIHYRPDLEKTVPNKPPLLIHQIINLSQNEVLFRQSVFAAANKSLPKLSIKAKAKILKFEVDLFQFNGFENQQFRYYLKGFDEGFGAWTDNASKEYTNLREGNYTFMVQSKNQLGEIIEGQPMSFTVEAPFYRTTFAKAGYLLLLVLLVLFILYLQRKRHNEKVARTQEAQQLELAKKQQKMAEMEQQKEHELLQLQEEKINSEIQHVKNLLAASTMNLVVKNEFIESIKEDLTRVKDQGINKSAKKTLEKLVREIDVNLRIQEDWEQFQYHFDAVHGDFLSRLREEYPDISPNEQKLCAFLRLNLNTKDISNLLGISVRGVEVARYRLRKKLNLETGQNLSMFILEY